MEKITLWNGFDVYYNEDICIAEINFKLFEGITKNKWCITDVTDTTVPQELRPNVPVTVRNDGTGQIWLKLKTDGFLEVYSPKDWEINKSISLRATMVWRKRQE